MVGLGQLARTLTDLDERSIDHLHRLVAAWAPLADLSFSDLLLYAPCSPGAAAYADAGVEPSPVQASERFVVLAHVRANSGPTVHISDPVGARVPADANRWLNSALADGESGHAETAHFGDQAAVDSAWHDAAPQARLEMDYVPVRVGDDPIAVLARQSAPAGDRHINPLKTVYLGLYERFAQMVADGTLPYERVEQLGEFREPRVGDGVMVLDYEGRITYASPNANSALRRLGVIQTVLGSPLSALGLDDTVIWRSFWRRRSTLAEFDAGSRVTVMIRSFPFVADDRITGAVALLRDISELRHRDRLLVSKDATIREIHHRVKNNLQTVSALLRLQARRLGNAEAKAAVESSVRRISSIATVHEHLALDITSEVDFDAIVAPLVRMVEEGLTAAEKPLRIRVDGTAGAVDGEVAMPLSVVLAELLQNAHDHAAPAADLVNVRFDRSADTVSMRVTDTGPGVPDGFSLDRDAGLGLTIVRTFVVHHLGGRIAIGAAAAAPPRGTVVDVTVPRRTPAAEMG